jgi:PAS domain-containing protein
MDMTSGGIAAGLVVALGGFVIAYMANSTRLVKRIDELTTKVFQLQDEGVDCKRREGELKLEVSSLTQRIIRMEKQQGVLEHELRVGVIVSDLRGTIKVFSPTLVPLFKWLPTEIVGKNVGILIPQDIKERHNIAFTKVAGDPYKDVDPSKVIITEGLDKMGSRIPITITLDGFQVGDQGLITATIRERDVTNKGKSGNGGSGTSGIILPPGAN